RRGPLPRGPAAHRHRDHRRVPRPQLPREQAQAGVRDTKDPARIAMKHRDSKVRAGPLLVAALYLVYVASFAWSIAVPDTARDAFIAHAIRHGEMLPLEGPVLGVPSAIHFGPLWYYLVSVPLWLSDSWIAFVLFQGAVCGLKFPLAWHCGRRIAG